MHTLAPLTALDELRAHGADPQTPTLPYTAERIELYEQGGYIVDLSTGHRFRQFDDWDDFARRWAAHRGHIGQPLDPDALADAICAAAEEPVDVEAVGDFARATIPRLRPRA